MSDLTADQIVTAVAESGTIVAAAERLGIHERNLRRAITRLGIRDEVASARGTTERLSIDDPQRLALASKDAELRELRRETRQYAEVLAKREEWLAEVVEAARVPARRPNYRVAPASSSPTERSIILPLFDLQYGQFVRPEDVPFHKGGYSEAIFDERLAQYIEKVTALLRDRAATTNFTELHFVLGGDLAEGDQIFRGQAWQLQKNPIRQALDLRDKLGDAIEKIIGFAKERLGVSTIAVYAVPGNHGKVGGKMSGATPSDYSWDYIAAELILDRLREQPIDLKVNESSGALLFETQEHVFLTIHGDEVKGHSGIPFYGLTKFDGRAIRLAEVVYDYCLLGHHHQPANIPNGSGGEFIISPDWVGGNNLSKHIVAASRPGQNLLLVGAKQGIPTVERIYFDDRRKRVRPTIHNARRK